MASIIASSKRVQISKANTTVVIAVAICTVITAFSLVISKSLLSQRAYQSRVIKEQEKSLKVAKANNSAVSQLISSYQAFDAQDPNIIGGNANGTTDRDGDNAKVVLDALPSKYDFPALISSLEKVLTQRNFKIDSITGTDNPEDTTAPVATSAIEMPFQVGVKGSYSNIQGLIDALEHSIRPIVITSIDLSGDEANMTLSLKANTYYQPGQTLNVTTKVVK
jgi:hypothetical protein